MITAQRIDILGFNLTMNKVSTNQGLNIAKCTEAVARRCLVKKVFLETSQNSQENASAKVSFLIKLQTSGLAQVFFSELCEISKNTYSYRTLVAASECSRTLEFEKGTDQNFITQNLCHGKQYCVSKKKKLFKECQREVIYEYTCGVVVHFFGKWQVMVDVFWLVVGGDAWWCVIAGGGGYILAGVGWW